VTKGALALFMIFLPIQSGLGGRGSSHIGTPFINSIDSIAAQLLTAELSPAWAYSRLHALRAHLLAWVYGRRSETRRFARLQLAVGLTNAPK
jgi:hypothetical protein